MLCLVGSMCARATTVPTVESIRSVPRQFEVEASSSRTMKVISIWSEGEEGRKGAWSRNFGGEHAAEEEEGGGSR